MTDVRRLCGAIPIQLTPDGQAPTEVRVFAAGRIETDYGPSVLTPKSIASVLEIFATRGNDMCWDIDHLSLAKDRPAESGRAAGWTPCPGGLFERDGELWAKVAWCEDIKAGIEATPPLWRYFSPAYDQDPKTAEITMLVNVAVTNNPATWGLNRLANIAGTVSTMDEQTKAMCVAILDALMKLAESATDDATKAWATETAGALKTMLGDGADEAVAARRAAMEEEAPASQKEPMKTSIDPAMAKLQTELAAAKVKNLVLANLGKRIAESQRAWAEGLTEEGLNAFLKSAPLIQATRPAAGKTRTPDPALELDGPKVELTAEDRKLCSWTKVKPEAILALKKQAAIDKANAGV